VIECSLDHRDFACVARGDGAVQLIASDHRQGVTAAFLRASEGCLGHLRGIGSSEGSLHHLDDGGAPTALSQWLHQIRTSQYAHHVAFCHDGEVPYDTAQISIYGDNVGPALLHRSKRLQIAFIRRLI